MIFKTLRIKHLETVMGFEEVAMIGYMFVLHCVEELGVGVGLKVLAWHSEM